MSIESALDEFSIKYERRHESYLVLCPFHSDNSPSGSILRKSSHFHCFTCRTNSSLHVFIARTKGLSLSQVKLRLGAKSDCRSPIQATEVEADHNKIWENPALLHQLRHRCINDDIIRKRRYGVRFLGGEARISIPILNEVGEYATLRLYLPGAPEKKFLNLAGKDRAKIRLYPIEQMEFDTILICGGELKADLAAFLLNKYDIGAIAPTCGENVWPHEYNDKFLGKLVYILLDDDDTGYKYSEIRARTLAPFARAIHKCEFPKGFFQSHNVQKGDINDFERCGGNLYELLLNTPEWKLIPGGQFEAELAIDTSFRDAFASDNTGKRMRFQALVSTSASNEYIVPSLVNVKCGRANSFCTLCDVNSQAMSIAGSTEMRIAADHSGILGLANEKTDDHGKTYRSIFRIPGACKECLFQPLEYHKVREIRMDEPVEPTSRVEPLVQKIGFIVNPPHSLDNECFNLTGRMYPMPRNQLVAFLASECEHTKDAFDVYEPPDNEYFKIFTPDEWTYESITKKMEEIYEDLEANITHVWQRRDYHYAIGLTYMSVLHFDLGEVTGLNGYIEMLAVGDTAQAKSTAVQRLKSHFGLGAVVDCKNVTLPGLTIGLDRGSGKHFAIYGAFPKNDRKLLILEELKGMDPKVFQKLTEIRSSGIVSITKIENRSRRARCRLIAITNPPDSREIGSYAYGIESALAVIGTNEDLRRFDLVMILSRTDTTDIAQIQRNPPRVEHKFTEDICQKLVLKAWKCEKVVFENIDYILEKTQQLVSKFGYGPPVLDANSSHVKLAKLSNAVAAHTCSYIEDNVLYVRNCHVEFAFQFLIRVYTSTSCRLDEKSASVEASKRLKHREALYDYMKVVPNIASILEQIMLSDTISQQDMQALTGDFMQGAALLSKLLHSNALYRISSGKYAKNSEFVEWAKTLSFTIPKPEYATREGF